jgi:hypothetical protein
MTSLAKKLPNNYQVSECIIHSFTIEFWKICSVPHFWLAKGAYSKQQDVVSSFKIWDFIENV